jgi:hypothetical protein
MLARNLKWLGSVAAAALPLLAGYAQTPSSTAPSTSAAAPAAPKPGDAALATQPAFASNVAEVVKLARSNVGDEVVIAFIKNSQSPYRLGPGDVLALKDAGLSSPVVAAMLAHDNAPPSQHEALASLPPGAPGTSSPYTYQQKLYGPSSEAEAAPAKPTAPAPPGAQPAPPAPPAPPAQPVPPQPPAAPAPVVVQQPPPAPRVEVVTAAPGPGYYWAPGYWYWRGGAWVWIGGGWVPRPYSGAIWIGGRWRWNGRGYVWIGGGWR